MVNNQSREEKNKEVYPAETLPEGWEWHVFTNQTGYLQDPNGKTLYEIDLEGGSGFVSFTSYEGYLYGADSFIEAQREIEKLTNERLQKEQEEKLSQEDVEKIYPAKNLSEGWNWYEYDDGSGYLESPEGNHYGGFEIQMYGIVYKDLYTKDWKWTNQSFEDFQLSIETEVENRINDLIILDQSVEYNNEEGSEFEI